MTQEQANEIVAQYQRDSILPEGFDAESSPHESTVGDEYEIVHIFKGGVIVISYTTKNGHIEGNIDVVAAK
jgi:hypothetical protein